MSMGPLYVLLGEVSAQVLCPFFNWVVCLPGVEYLSSLHILEIKPMSKVSLTNKFSNIVGSFFILMMVSSAVQKLYNLMKSHLFILSFISLALEDVSVKILLCGISEIVLPMFSLRTFMVL